MLCLRWDFLNPHIILSGRETVSAQIPWISYANYWNVLFPKSLNLSMMKNRMSILTVKSISLFLASFYQVCYIKKKGKPQKRLPLNCLSQTFIVWPSTNGSRWRLFSFIPEDLITKTYKGYNEYSYLNQISICNIHWQRPPSSFVWRVSPSEISEGKPPGALVSHYDNIT